ncbi:MAG: transcription termination/antitermination NusG family protein [Bacteroidales bacterium]|nr:transcription termination/antitermination NusG family protein [Bacteroidales bacterium]
MDWYIVYKGRSVRNTLQENLRQAGLKYFTPTRIVEKYEGDRMVEREEPVLNNLIFIQTDGDISQLVGTIDGLRSPYLDRCTGRPAVVRDCDMQRFKQFLVVKNMHVRFLPDNIERFSACPKVRVRAGDFEGVEGYAFRIRGDRKVVIALGNMAVAISGIHHSLLEYV